MTTAIVLLLALVVGLLAWLMGFSYGLDLGYRKGFDASEYNHDFDRCKNCGEAPWAEPEEEE